VVDLGHVEVMVHVYSTSKLETTLSSDGIGRMVWRPLVNVLAKFNTMAAERAAALHILYHTGSSRMTSNKPRGKLWKVYNSQHES
jgi:hypothetical protein